MNPIKWAFTVLVLILQCGVLHAQTLIGSTPWPPDFYRDARELLADLERPKDNFENIAYWGRGHAYLMAILDESRYSSINAIEAFKSNAEMKEKLMDDGVRRGIAATFTCIGSEVSRAQVEAVVVKFIKGNPAIWHHRAMTVVKDALKASFPCNPDVFLPR